MNLFLLFQFRGDYVCICAHTCACACTWCHIGARVCVCLSSFRKFSGFDLNSGFDQYVRSHCWLCVHTSQ